MNVIVTAEWRWRKPSTLDVRWRTSQFTVCTIKTEVADTTQMKLDLLWNPQPLKITEKQGDVDVLQMPC